MKARPPIVYPVLACLFSALIIVGAYIAIPLPGIPVPIVLQNLFVMLAALILGPVWGTISVLLYLFLGIIGLPVFSGGTGGLARLWGPTGGFLVGYIPSTLCMGLISRIGSRLSWWKAALAIVAGSVLLYACGIPVLKFAIHKSWLQTFAIGALPFLPGDAIKALIAVPIAMSIRPWLAARLEESKPLD